jgi:hypothetical protein
MCFISTRDSARLAIAVIIICAQSRFAPMKAGELHAPRADAAKKIFDECTENIAKLSSQRAITSRSPIS